MSTYSWRHSVLGGKHLYEHNLHTAREAYQGKYIVYNLVPSAHARVLILLLVEVQGSGLGGVGILDRS